MNVKHLPIKHRKHFRYAIQHSLSGMERTGGIIGRAAAITVKRIIDLSDSVINTHEMTGDNVAFGIVAASEFEMDFFATAIQEWAAHLEWASATGTMISDSAELARVFGMVEWHGPLDCNCAVYAGTAWENR